MKEQKKASYHIGLKIQKSAIDPPPYNCTHESSYHTKLRNYFIGMSFIIISTKKGYSTVSPTVVLFVGSASSAFIFSSDLKKLWRLDRDISIRGISIKKISRLLYQEGYKRKTYLPLSRN